MAFFKFSEIFDKKVAFLARFYLKCGLYWRQRCPCKTFGSVIQKIDVLNISKKGSSELSGYQISGEKVFAQRPLTWLRNTADLFFSMLKVLSDKKSLD